MIKHSGIRISLIVKMMVAFLAVIFPMILGYVMMYTQGRELLYTRVLSNMDARQEYLSRTIEDELISIYTRQMNITLNADLSYLIDMYDMVSDYRRFELISSIQKSIDMFQESSAWIANIRVYLPSVNRTLQSDDGISPLLEDYGLLSESSKDRFVSFLVENGNFCIVNRESTRRGEVRYLTVVEISSPVLEDFFMYLYSQQSSDIILSSADGDFIFSHVGENAVEEPDEEFFRAIFSLKPEISQKLNVGKKGYFIRWDPVFFENFSLISITSQERAFAELWEYTGFFFVLLLISLTLIGLFLFTFTQLFNRPIIKLNSAFSELRHGNFSVHIQYKGHDEFSLLYEGFDYMVTKIRELIQDNYQQKILVQQAELRQLHAQVDPHFLHNSFLNLCAMAQMEDYEGIEEMSRKLSQYYQYTTHSNQNIVRLEEECRFVSLYADIQNIRFNQKTECILEELPEQYKQIPIPRSVLQTLVENAYKYGVSDREEGGLILLRFERGDGALNILVEDNGTRFSDEKLKELSKVFEKEEFSSTGTGIYNACQRIRMYYKNSSGLFLERSALGGLRVRVRIEINEEGKENNVPHIADG